MSIKLRVCRYPQAAPEADSTREIPDGSLVVISEYGDVEVTVPQITTATRQEADQAKYEAEAQVKDGPVSRYSVLASTTAHGRPPEAGGYADVLTNIHEPDPTAPEVRPLVRIARVTNTNDPNPEKRRNRKVELELELSQSEIQRIQGHEHRNSFTFRPVDANGNKIRL